MREMDGADFLGEARLIDPVARRVMLVSWGDTVVLEREALGGQAGQSTMIRNYLGFPAGVSGAELAYRAHEQAWQFAAESLFANEAASPRSDEDGVRVVGLVDGSSLRACPTGRCRRRRGRWPTWTCTSSATGCARPSDARLFRGRPRSQRPAGHSGSGTVSQSEGANAAPGSAPTTNIVVPASSATTPRTVAGSGT